MIITIVCSLIVAVFSVVGAVLFVERSRRTVKDLRANVNSLQNKLALEVQANTRLEIDNARLLVEAKELRAMAVQGIDKELVAKVRAVAA